MNGYVTRKQIGDAERGRLVCSGHGVAFHVEANASISVWLVAFASDGYPMYRKVDRIFFGLFPLQLSFADVLKYCLIPRHRSLQS